MRITTIFVFLSVISYAQDVQVEYDKNRDLSRYKTFHFGETEVITPKDQRQAESASLIKWVTEAIAMELKSKGLQQLDSAADLVASFVVGSDARMDLQQLGGGGMMPGSNERTWSRDYRVSSLIIDLNDKSNNLIWRVNATTTDAGNNPQRMIDNVVAEGFRKFSLKPKKVKKKK